MAAVERCRPPADSPEEPMRTSTILLSSSMALALLAPVGALEPVHAQEVRTGADAFGSPERDRPGVRHHIRPQDLPPPIYRGHPEEPDFERQPTIVPRPAGVMPD